jgi:hypothetical protein
MLEHPSQIIATRMASAAESRTVQPMLSVQVRNMGTRLFWIWFWFVPESMVVMALWASGRGCSDMTKAGKQPMSTPLNLRGLAHSHGNEVVEMFGHCGFLDTRQKGTFTAKGAKEENLTTDNTDWTDFHG